MADQSLPIDLAIVVGDDVEDTLYQQGTVRGRALRFDWMPHVLRYAINNPGDVMGDEQLTVTNALKTLTVPDMALSCIVQVQTNPIRWSVGATDPTAAIGMRSDANNSFTLGGIPAMRKFRAIREGAADATIIVVYFN